MATEHPFRAVILEAMKLDLRFTRRPLEDLWCPSLIAMVFQGPVEKWVPGLDGKMSGYLNSLWKRGFWTGTQGETLLLASQNMLKAEKIILKGLGRPDEYDAGVLVRVILETSRTLDKLGIRELALRIPALKGLEGKYSSHLETACVHMMDYFIGRHLNDAEYMLKVVVSLDSEFTGELEAYVVRMCEYFSPRVSCSIISPGVGGKITCGGSP